VTARAARPRTAFDRVYEGRVDPPEPTFEAADALWCRIAAQGRIVGRHHDGAGEPYRVHLTLIEHPDLPSSQAYALFGMTASATLTVYRCLPEDAVDALRGPGAYNL
jgi:hypothetical protein